MGERIDTDAMRERFPKRMVPARIAHDAWDEIDRLRAENEAMRDLFCDEVDKRRRLPRSAEVAGEQRAAQREALGQPDLLGALERSLEAARMERLAHKRKDGDR